MLNVRYAVSLVVILCLGVLLPAGPASAGRLLATGHDPDLHCASSGLQCHYFQIAVEYVRGGAPDPALPVLILDRLNLDAEVALDNAFPPDGTVPRVVMDPRGATFASAPLLTSFVQCDHRSFGFNLRWLRP